MLLSAHVMQHVLVTVAVQCCLFGWLTFAMVGWSRLTAAE
jgi:hypothetical protein